jgi:Dolichyl-phosphate-mannose-protein mannosyltransferase
MSTRHVLGRPVASAARGLGAVLPSPSGGRYRDLPVPWQAVAGAGRRPARPAAPVPTAIPLAAILAVAVFLRFWQLSAVGFNGDEAVYTGTAASLSDDHALRALFPVFRAHPLLFQALLSLVLRIHESDWVARAFAAAIGVAAVGMTFLLGRRLYGRGAGLLAALLLAVMPYHVIVSRQVLLDGPMTLCATAALYCLVRYLQDGAPGWLLAGGAAMGAAILSKETSVVLLGGLYAFFALTPAARMRLKHLLPAVGVMLAEVAVWPVSLRLSGQGHTGQAYLLWQMFRRPNHGTWFYLTVLPPWAGPATAAAALGGLVWLRREATWRERLLIAWLAVPLIFFTLWPVKGFEYLLPVTPPLAILAGRTLARPLPLPDGRWRHPRWLPGVATGLLAAITAASLLTTTWSRIEPGRSTTFLAGSGGLEGGRQAGDWIARNAPRGARLLTIGPSLANVLEFYGRRPVSALSVSPNRHNRNPAYAPVPNPDRALRDGVFQYIVWDSYTAARTPFFAAQAHRLAVKYHGVAVFTSSVTVRTSSGGVVEPVVVIYEVRP